jgi:hypothetical protein
MGVFTKTAMVIPGLGYQLKGDDSLDIEVVCKVARRALPAGTRLFYAGRGDARVRSSKEEMSSPCLST